MLWAVLFGGGLITFSLRWSFLALADHLSLPPAVRRALRYVPVAVFSAMAWPPVVIVSERIAIGPGNLRLWAAIIAALVAWKTRNVLYTVAAGMLVLLGLSMVTGSAV